ncbi:MAG TPA: helix-turn-helix transcriptional regulator [Desulfitobacteriaceae bacterium]|nr:helix-turn-helix transcriptional regulator [Desulfitobacteriaceae bacterium]
MRHLVLILYFLTFASGAGTIILGSFYYLKKKVILVKYAVLFDLFFAAVVLFDTLNLYNQIFKGPYSGWLHNVIMYGIFLAGISMIYYFTSLIHSITGRLVTRNMKNIFFSMAFFCFLTLTGLQVLNALGLADWGMAGHTGFFISNIFIFVWACYNLYKLVTNFARIDMQLKPVVKNGLAILSLIIPVSVLFNIINYAYYFKYPVAFSPAVFLLLNVTVLYQLARNQVRLSDIFADPETALPAASGDRIPVNILHLSKHYNITGREAEIIKLIVAGQSNREIGKKLFLSFNTVRNYICSIYRKIGVKNRYELINLLLTLQKQE